MWVTRSILVLLTATMASSTPSLILDEPPTRVEVLLGSSLTLSCSFKAEIQVRVSWCFNPTGPSNNCSTKLSTELLNNKYVKQDVKNQEQDAEKMWSNFTLKHVVYNNSGWYHCEVIVEIPKYQQNFSNGTQVVITTMEHTTNALVTAEQETVPTTDHVLLLLHDWRFWTAFGAPLPIILLLVIFCVLLRRRHRPREVQNPIYANTRPMWSASRQPSPRPGMQLDNLKTAPAFKTLQTPRSARKQEDRWSPKP